MPHISLPLSQSRVHARHPSIMNIMLELFQLNTVNFSPILQMKLAIYQGSCIQEKEIIILFRNYCHCGPSVVVRAYRGQVINGILAQGSFTVSLLVSQPILFPQFQMHNWNRYTWQLTEPHISSLTSGVRIIMVGKANWKPL